MQFDQKRRAFITLLGGVAGRAARAAGIESAPGRFPVLRPERSIIANALTPCRRILPRLSGQPPGEDRDLQVSFMRKRRMKM
jgi:hypothetical protein